MIKFLKLITVAGFALLLVACEQQGAAQTVAEPVAFHADDECHVCGMIITNWPGPKGEILKGQDEIYKFCSTVDMLTWWLQPENHNQSATIYVHDMSETAWDNPTDEHLIDATQAWYVMGSTQMGMGPTLASFGNQQAAVDFAEQYQGEVLPWSEIDLALLQRVLHAGHNFSLDAEHQQHSAAH